jgi:PIN domain nuclease of toxin-antitoxin system
VIVLDTHALIWWVNGDVQLSTKARKAIQREVTSDAMIGAYQHVKTI